MKTLLVIKSSLFNGQGQSSQLADAFTARWRKNNPDGQVLCRDLALEPIAHLSAEAFKGFQVDSAERTPEQHGATAVSDSLIAELKSADEVVLGLPMYNFSVPSTLKAWMDHVARAGVTFRYSENGPKGLIDDKPLYVLAARGGHYQGTEKDTQTPLVRMFFNMLGIRDIRFTYAEGLAMGPEQAEQSRMQAAEAIEQLTA
ncbi:MULTISPECIES: FMN-dependent NADH-azoreductase [unclassified Wenzhouxiangella]|uniref:FMN-dependent NADH-azoreductase n=1 Tax=unclassified Wenzhouxiangella TaxID=2613841 RepID=UPI000E3293ED|nr:MULTISPECIES: NAD(P)H-dependent oxidoreductase [unclassified Wenzhouxiangella]RFF27382.1 FMN-dependent NADH-azoreductase [Wenzhouxiangella sp. 15181]RFP68810.1 FMN-dependent NADH-azoreductase [Wenzhouxiangella sp. 15190]